MTYRVVNGFRDTEDNNQLYKVGEEYPKGNYEPTQERINFLSDIHPRLKRIFIEKIETVDDEKVEKETIMDELESLGITVHPNTGLAKLREKLDEAKAEKE